jgi:hypothetical protein
LIGNAGDRERECGGLWVCGERERKAGDREYVGVGVCGEREGSRVQIRFKGSNESAGTGKDSVWVWGWVRNCGRRGSKWEEINQGAFESGLILLYRAGKSLQTTSQIVGKLTPKYPWIKRFRIATICDHGISGCRD